MIVVTKCVDAVLQVIIHGMFYGKRVGIIPVL